MFKKIFYFISFSIVILSCQQPTRYTEIKINNRYTIALADYLKPCNDLHTDASLQYQNTERDIYVLVIDEKKSKMEKYNMDFTVDKYFKNIASQPFLESIKDGKISILIRSKINGNTALISEITGNIEQTAVYYKLAIIETPFTFYQVLIWTRSDNKLKYEKDMLQMIESFNELPIANEELPIKSLDDSIINKAA